MKRFLTGSLAAVLALGFLGCEPATKQDVEEIKAQQAEILAKLGAIEAAQKQGAAPARRGPPAEDYKWFWLHPDLPGAPKVGPEYP